MSKKLVLLLIVFGVVAGFSSLASALPLIGAVDRSGGASGDRDHIGLYTGEDDPLPTQDGGWTFGNYCFSDRDYTWNVVPAEMDGAEQICTFNSDKGNRDTVTYTVNFPIGATVLLAADDRFGTQQGYVDSIVVNFAAAGEFTDTGWDVHVFGDSDPPGRPLSVYSAELDPGTYVFIGANAGGNNFYVIGALPPPIPPGAPRNPDPNDGATDLPVETILSWERGQYCEFDDVYFGTDPCALLLVDTIHNTSLAEHDPGDPLGDPTLVASRTYYWQVIDRDGNDAPSPGEVWSFSTISGKTHTPLPFDGIVVPGTTQSGTGNIYQTLSFQQGPTNVRYVGYGSEFYVDVLTRAEDANLGPLPFPPTKTYYMGLDYGTLPYKDSLERGKAYYWCVDGVDAKGNKFAGDVWKFIVQDMEAFDPNPPDEAIFVSMDVLLDWEAGYGPSAVSLDHDVYMGTDFDAVNDANWIDVPQPPEYKGSYTETYYQCGGLESKTTYYWRIDECWDRKPWAPKTTGTYVKGHVWSFTTGVGQMGLAGEYYHHTGGASPAGFESKMLVRVDPEINFDWGTDRPDPLLDRDDFSVRWTGQLGVPYPGETYTFTTETDDGVRLWVNDVLLIDQWIDQGPTQYSGEIQLDSFGPYNIKMEYYENAGGAVARLYWSSPSTPYGIIPSTYLAPSSTEAEYALGTTYNLHPRHAYYLMDWTTPIFTWGPGKYAAEYNLYLSTDFDEVSNRAISPKVVTGPNYMPSSQLDLELDQTYYWMVDGVNTLGPEPYLWEGTVWSFTIPRGGTGSVLREWWTGIGGGDSVSDLTSASGYPRWPHGSEFVDDFEGPTGWANNYGSRIHGYLRPPTTGDYTFWIATDDGGELWLSTDEDPDNAVRVSWITDGEWAASRDWDDVDVNPSVPITLQAGKKYYIAGLMKEGTGGDNISAAWQGPANSPIPDRELISGEYLSPTPYDPLEAFAPYPADGATNVEDRNPILSWLPGTHAKLVDGHMLYFSDNFADVNERRTAAYIDTLTDPNYPYPPPPLLLNQTYFWVVDEVNSFGPAPYVWYGRVWRFTTSDCLFVDNMEVYDDRDDIRGVWTDGNAHVLWGGEEPLWVLLRGGSSGSNLSVSTAVGAPSQSAGIPDPGPIRGLQTMALFYDNDGYTHPAVPGEEHRVYDAPYFSEIEANTVENLGIVSNWAAEGVKALSLQYQGHPISDGSYEWLTGPVSPYPFLYATLNGRGRDIWGNHDEFYYLGWYPITHTSGGCEFQAKVIRMDNTTDPDAKAGVMMRENMTPYSRYAAVFITPNNGVTFQWRADVAGPTDSFTEPGISAPIKLKLERLGGTGAFVAKYYEGGVWQDVNDANGDGHDQLISDMNDQLHVGIVVTSHNADLICSADFNELGFLPALPGDVFLDWGFIGNVGLNDAEQMYMALEDGTGTVSVVIDPDPNAATWCTNDTADWQEWNIALTDFTNLDFNDVRKVYIGLGNRDTPAEGGKGIVYFDDFRTCPPRCVPLKAKPYADIAGPDGVGDGYYDCVVDEADMAELMFDWLLPDEYITAVAPHTGPIAHWPLDTDYLDDSGNNFYGTPMGGAVLVADADRGQVLSLDGDGDFVDCGNPTDPCALDFGTVNWTVSAWVKTAMRGTGDENKGLIYAKGGDHTGGHRYGLYMNETQDPQGCISVITDDNADKFVIDSGVINGDWHHVAGLRDVNDLRLYIDGLPDGTATLPAGYDLSGTHQHNAYIGVITDNRDPNGIVLEKYLRGSVDDVRIYDYALSPEEIAYLATDGGAGIHLPIVSPANLYNDELPGQQWINFRDYSIIAGSWLEKVIWP